GCVEEQVEELRDAEGRGGGDAPLFLGHNLVEETQGGRLVPFSLHKLFLDAFAPDAKLDVPPAVEGAEERLSLHGKPPVRDHCYLPAVNLPVCHVRCSAPGAVTPGVCCNFCCNSRLSSS